MARRAPSSTLSGDNTSPVLSELFYRLSEEYGPQHWWPAQTQEEIVVGAILTQNTAWTNVVRAIANLRAAGALNFAALRDLPQSRMEELIRPSGTYRVKAARLKAFVEYLWQYHEGQLESLLAGDVEEARARLLTIHGIGPETADAILLYAGGRATFVVDAYTRRVFRRHKLIEPSAGYESIRAFVHRDIPPQAHTYNEFHALLVEVGKRHCRTRARCTGCPLADLPHDETL